LTHPIAHATHRALFLGPDWLPARLLKRHLAALQARDLRRIWSTQLTDTPNSEKHAPRNHHGSDLQAIIGSALACTSVAQSGKSFPVRRSCLLSGGGRWE